MCCRTAAQRARRCGCVRCAVLARLGVGPKRACRGCIGLVLPRRVHMAEPRRRGQGARVRIGKERIARRCPGHSADRGVHSVPMRGRSTRVDVLCQAGNFGHALRATRGRAYWVDFAGGLDGCAPPRERIPAKRIVRACMRHHTSLVQIGLASVHRAPCLGVATVRDESVLSRVCRVLAALPSVHGPTPPSCSSTDIGDT